MPTVSVIRCLHCGAELKENVADGICPVCGTKSVLDLAVSDRQAVMRALAEKPPFWRNLFSDLKAAGLVVAIGLFVITVLVVRVALLRSPTGAELALSGTSRVAIHPVGDVAKEWKTAGKQYRDFVAKQAESLLVCLNPEDVGVTSGDVVVLRLEWRLLHVGSVQDVQILTPELTPTITTCLGEQLQSVAAAGQPLPSEATVNVPFVLLIKDGRLQIGTPTALEVVGLE